MNHITLIARVSLKCDLNNQVSPQGELLCLDTQGELTGLKWFIWIDRVNFLYKVNISYCIAEVRLQVKLLYVDSQL